MSTSKPKSLTLLIAVASAFAFTVAAARLLSYVSPRTHWQVLPEVHIHHYAFGIFMLAIAGYLALTFKGPRATIWIASLYGTGLALTFDEFSMWLYLRDRGVRWNYTGLVLVGAVFLITNAVVVLCKTLPRNRILRTNGHKERDQSTSVSRLGDGSDSCNSYIARASDSSSGTS